MGRCGRERASCESVVAYPDDLKPRRNRVCRNNRRTFRIGKTLRLASRAASEVERAGEVSGERAFRSRNAIPNLE
jgi:hypothetical protein